MKSFRPDSIYIDENSLNDPLTERVLARFPKVPYEILPANMTGGNIGFSKGANGKPRRLRDRPSRETITKGKRLLFLQRNRGPFIERCPGTRDALCCNYFIANLAVNCHFDCTYCYLQSYLNTQNITINTNIHDFLTEIEEMARANPGKQIRVGTGELADSLALDEITDFSKDIVPAFARFDNLLLELKTKGDYIDNLLSVDPNGRSVIAWSVNPQNIIDSEEHKTASLESRLKAAQKCFDAGYKLAFHFDPIILHDGWEENYRNVVDRIFESIDPENILWISLGVLRFTQAGKTAIQKRFPNSDIVYEEMVQCSDGKLRYIQPVRSEIFSKMRSWITEKSPSTFTYLCMESPAVFNRVYGEDHPMLDEIISF